MIDFKGVVERIRQVRGVISQKDFAEKAGVNAAYLSNIENLRTKPSMDFLVAVSVAFDISLDWLMGSAIKSGNGAIVKGKGIQVIGNYGSISQKTDAVTGGSDSILLDRLISLGIENAKLKEELAGYPDLKDAMESLKERNKKLETVIMSNGIVCD